MLKIDCDSSIFKGEKLKFLTRPFHFPKLREQVKWKLELNSIINLVDTVFLTARSGSRKAKGEGGRGGRRGKGHESKEAKYVKTNYLNFMYSHTRHIRTYNYEIYVTIN